MKGASAHHCTIDKGEEWSGGLKQSATWCLPCTCKALSISQVLCFISLCMWWRGYSRCMSPFITFTYGKFGTPRSPSSNPQMPGSNYFVRILSTLNRELLKPNCSVALHRHSHAVVDILPPEADSTVPKRQKLIEANQQPAFKGGPCENLTI